MKTPLKITSDRVPDVLKALQAMAKKEVLIGIPEEESSRPGETISNAELGYIHEFGSPASNIPARPFLIPGVEQAQKGAAAILKEGAQETLSTNKPIDESLDRAGVLASNSVKRQFTSPTNGWPPDSPATIARKGSDRPLIDTAELRRSVTHVVVKK